MKATITDITRYGFCPKFYEQQGEIPVVDPQGHKEFNALLTFAFRKQMESGEKISWKSLLERWTKTYWSDGKERTKETDRKYNQSLIALKAFNEWYLNVRASVLAVNFALKADFYRDQLLGDIPVVLNNPDSTVTLVLTESFTSPGEIKWSPAVRYLSVAMDQQLPVSKIINLSFGSGKFAALEVIPTKRFWESALLDLSGIMQSMHEGVSYSNTLACRFCPIAATCEALNE